MSRPQTYDHLKSAKKPITRKVLIALDPEIGDSFLDAQDRFNLTKVLVEMKVDDPNMQSQRAKDFEDAAEKLEIAKAALEENSAEFVFRSIGRKKYEELLLQHVPTEAQAKRAKDAGESPYQWNPDTFPVAVLAKSIVTPELSEEEIAEIWNGDDWSQAETLSILEAAISCNTFRRDLNLGKG